MCSLLCLNKTNWSIISVKSVVSRDVGGPRPLLLVPQGDRICNIRVDDASIGVGVLVSSGATRWSHQVFW